jgi:hypothetical protein
MELLLLEAWKHCMPGPVTSVCGFRPCSAGAGRQQRGRWAARVKAQRAEGATKDGSEAGSGRISTGFGSSGFGFEDSFASAVFRVWIPERLRVWDGSLFFPADHHWSPEIIELTSSPSNNLAI